MDNDRNWGGARQGAGRPVGWRKGTSEARKQWQLRAHANEWELIKAFANHLKANGKLNCIKFLENEGVVKMKYIVRFSTKESGWAIVGTFNTLAEAEAEFENQLQEDEKEEWENKCIQIVCSGEVLKEYFGKEY